MNERILLISDLATDLSLFEKILIPRGFRIERRCPRKNIDAIVLQDDISAIIADYQQLNGQVFAWLQYLQKNRSKACVILYGDSTKTEKISELLQSGAYGYVPRSQLAGRIYDTLLEGLENRKAFVDILQMLDGLKDMNKKLKKEKETLRKKNQELRFIHRLSSEVAYDLNWDKILHRVLRIGLLKIVNPLMLGILYRINSQWHLTFHSSARKDPRFEIDTFKTEVIDGFFHLSGLEITGRDMILEYVPSPSISTPRDIRPIVERTTRFFILDAKPNGMLVLVTPEQAPFDRDVHELMTTMSNILAMSLKNAQEYHMVKELAIKDGLTGLFNRKGFSDFIQKEFQRARRYHKSMALAMMDVDNFKRINDSLGHQAGDYALKELARCFAQSVRQSDIVTRHGGDEFAILLPETDSACAAILMERVLSTVKRHRFQWKSERLDVGISCGIATTEEIGPSESEEELILKADARLYACKQNQTMDVSMAQAV